MKISLVIPSLGCGGAERVLTTIANYWAGQGNEVSLITIDSIDNDFYDIDSRINRIGLDLFRSADSLWAALFNNMVRINRLRDVVKEINPDFVISFIDHMNVMTLLATRGLNLKVIISERIDPREHYIGKIKSLLRKYVYPRASAIVMQTNSLREWAQSIVPDKSVYIIPNPLPALPDVTNDSSLVAVDAPFVIAMGRLVEQKGFDMLINAFAQCYKHNKSWSLLILGEGPEREKLEKLSKELGVDSRVKMPGRIHNQIAALKRASIFVLSSRYEGFPNALLEAMHCGLPVISFDCPTGPADIIIDDKNGKLVPNGDIQQLVSAMSELMNNSNVRNGLSEQAVKVSNKYSLSNIMMLWDSMLTELIE